MNLKLMILFEVDVVRESRELRVVKFAVIVDRD